MDTSSPAFWENLLRSILDPSTVSVASESVRGLLLQPQNVLACYSFMQNNQAEPGLRQLAGVLCCRVISSHWGKFTPQVQEEIQKSLINTISDLTNQYVVRRTAVQISVKVAVLTVPQGRWPSFLPVVAQLAAAPEANNRELALYVFQNMLETDSLRTEVILPNIVPTHQMIITCLHDADVNVKVRAMSCANAFLECFPIIDSEIDPGAIKPLLELISPILQAIKTTIEAGDERVGPGFECVEFFVEFCADAIKPIINDLLNFVLFVGSCADLDISIRRKAILLVEFIINYKTKTFVKTGLVNHTIEVAFRIMAEPIDDDEDDEEESAYKFASQILDTMAMSVPHELVFQPVLTHANALIQSPDKHQRKAAIVALTVIAEGCCDQLEEVFDQLMAKVLTTIKDPEDVVRQASCVCIAEFAKAVPGNIIEYAEQLVPILLQGLTDHHDLVRIKTCYAITACGASMSEYFVPHINEMLQKLVYLLRDKNSEVKELAVSALSSLVEMAEERFEPYFDDVIVVMGNWMKETDESLAMVRARAMECVASLSSVIKAERFLPHVDSLLVAALNALNIDNSELRDYVYSFFEHITTNFAETTAKYIDQIMPYLIASAESTEGLLSFDDQNEFNLLQEDRDFETDIDFKAMTAFMNEKTSAISCLGCIAEDHPQSFAKYVEEVNETLIQLSGFDVTPPVASAALSALVQICTCVQKLVDPEYDWDKGELADRLTQAPALYKVISDALTACLTNLATSDELLVRGALDAIGKLGIQFGPIVYQQHLGTIEEALAALLTRSAPCQKVRESFDGDEDDFVMFATVMELLSRLAKILGVQYVPSLTKLFRYFEPYLDPQKNIDYTNCCVATVAEIAQELQEGFKPFCEAFLPITITLMESQDGDRHVKHNAVYCAGLLAQYGGDAAYKFYPHLVNAIGPLFACKGKKYYSVIDNAVGAVSRMILTQPSLLPLEQVLPVLLNALPLRDDLEPAIPAYNCIFELLKANNPVILSHVPAVIGLFATEIICGEETLGGPVREQMLEFTRQAAASQPEVVHGVLNSLQLDPQGLEQLRGLLR